MKTKSMILAVVVAAHVFAYPGYVVANEMKDPCLVYGENCQEQSEAVTEKIARLQKEVAKGLSVYTQLELDKLETKLEEYEQMQAVLTLGGE